MPSKRGRFIRNKEGPALIDSGADESLMDKALASSLGITMEPLQSPVSARGQQRTGEQIPNPSDYPDISKVPPCYHDLKEVFNKAKAMSLPPHREWDCAIDLLPGAPIPKAWLYSISSSERKAMEEYIETSLRFGIIRPIIITGRSRVLLCGGLPRTTASIHVPFLSRKLTPAAERNYDVGNKELLVAINVALKEWRHWLEGAEQPFIVWTDHKNLEYLKSAKRPGGWLNQDLETCLKYLVAQNQTTKARARLLSRPESLAIHKRPASSCPQPQTRSQFKLPRSLHVHPSFHISKLKPFRESPLVPPSKPPPPPKMVDGGPIYAVKKLLAVRKRGRERQFLVDWLAGLWT
ncbi:hypothetical protein L3Q82_024505 [Scortum barcoo]|uniref:Uncharacterized protein n=1 Tax=Scortum barcoo TaxID=214431 RepID=A0ACB8WPH4_9TELE|nr:hypothetical protein L3Q82_024505 [Scortum barcoo]